MFEPASPTPTRTPDELALIAARKERAQRWTRAGTSLNGYPTLTLEAETPATLAAVPPDQAGKR